MKHLKYKLFMIAIIVLAAGAIYLVAHKMIHKQDVKVQCVGSDGKEHGSDAL